MFRKDYLLRVAFKHNQSKWLNLLKAEMCKRQVWHKQELAMEREVLMCNRQVPYSRTSYDIS